MRHVAPLLVLIALAGVARADRVELVGAADLEGTVVLESAKEVVVRLRTGGEVGVPRAKVRRIILDDGRVLDFVAERANAARLARQVAASEQAARGLADADAAAVRSLVTTGAPAGTIATFLVARTRAYLDAAQPALAVRCVVAARTLANDAETGVLDAAEIDARVALCESSLAARAVRAARDALGTALGRSPGDRRLSYWDGRVCELEGDLDGADAAYWRVLSAAGFARTISPRIEVLHELARRARDNQTPGLVRALYEQACRGSGFKLTESAHLAVFAAPSDSPTPAKIEEYERIRGGVVATLGFRAEDLTPKVSIFVIENEIHFGEATRAARWAAGCAFTREHGATPAIVTFEDQSGGLEYVLGHELAHVYVADALPDLHLPRWAVEGVACSVEPGWKRHRKLEHARTVRARCPPLSLGELAESDRSFGEDAATLFYAQSRLWFEKLVARAGGVRRALEIAAASDRKGLDAFREAGVDPIALEESVLADLEMPPPRDEAREAEIAAAAARARATSRAGGPVALTALVALAAFALLRRARRRPTFRGAAGRGS